MNEQLTHPEYELVDDELDDDSNVCAKIFSCLYAYTIGSCLYFKSDTDRKATVEEIKLKSAISTKKNKTKERVLEEDGSMSSEWKRKIGLKADCKMKKRIQYHFKNHISRWTDKNRRRFPWKVILHLLLVALVTTQVTINIIMICISYRVNISFGRHASVVVDQLFLSYQYTVSNNAYIVKRIIYGCHGSIMFLHGCVILLIGIPLCAQQF